MNEVISEHLTALEKLLRRADEAVVNAKPGFAKRQATKQRNGINAACNALYRAYKA
jgi:hypothetical protein